MFSTNLMNDICTVPEEPFTPLLTIKNFPVQCMVVAQFPPCLHTFILNWQVCHRSSHQLPHPPNTVPNTSQQPLSTSFVPHPFKSKLSLFFKGYHDSHWWGILQYRTTVVSEWSGNIKSYFWNEFSQSKFICVHVGGDDKLISQVLSISRRAPKISTSGF